ncbi:MAG TPA: hypothetical protein VJZ71_15470 [Phycisphaerae bacterium]|nr:hypothetical protein [Phycisphaerae bacterium]
MNLFESTWNRKPPGPPPSARPREDVVREIMDLLSQLESVMNQLPSSESGELVDFVNLLRCRLSEPGPRLVRANKGG